MRLVPIVGEVALAFPNETEVAKNRKVGRSVLQAGNHADVNKGIDIATDPLTPPTALRVVDTIEEVVVDVVVHTSATRIGQGGADVTEFEIRLIAFPFIRGTRSLDVGNTQDEEWNRAIVVRIGDTTAGSHVQVQSSFRPGLGEGTETQQYE